MWIIVSALLIFLDQLSKWWARGFLGQYPVSLGGGFLKLTPSFNPGVAFSIPIPNIVMAIVTPILIGFLVFGIWKYCQIKKRATRLVLCLFVAGALGNLIDRVAFGGVTDFIAFSFWPSFNLADSCLTLAALLFIIFYSKITLTYGRSSH